MSQNSFDFIVPPKPQEHDLQEEITRHNRSMAAATQTRPLPSGSLLGALDPHATKLNAVYMLRGILARQIQAASTTLPPNKVRKNFINCLKAEINIKKSGQDAVVAIRHILMQTLT